MNDTLPPVKVPTGIKGVAFFRDGQGRCCDRCGTFIKNVALVSYKDGTIESYGSECINKILSGDTSLKKLWTKNAKLLQRYQEYLDILSLPVDQIPVDERGYYGRGYFFVADRSGKAFVCGERYLVGGRLIIGNPCYCFHPTYVKEPGLSAFDGKLTFDMRGPSGGTCWEANTLENWEKKYLADIEAKKAWLTFEIDRISKFLVRILEKGLLTPPQPQPTAA